MSDESTALLSKGKKKEFIEKTASDTISKTLSTLAAGVVLSIFAGVIAFVYGLPFWLYLPLAAVVFFLISFSLFLFRKHRHPTKDLAVDSNGLQLETEQHATIERLELEHTRKVAGLENQYASEMQTQQILYADLSKEKDRIVRRMLEYQWLMERADTQAETIADWVILDKFFITRVEEKPIPHAVFTFMLRNNSVFEVTLENAIEGWVEYQGTRLLGDKRFYDSPEWFHASTHKWFTFEHRLSREEYDLIVATDDATQYFYDVSKLIFTIRGNNNIKSHRLRIPQRCRVLNFPAYERATENF